MAEETPEEFSKIVRKQIGKTQRNVAKWRQKMRIEAERGNDGEYSEDD